MKTSISSLGCSPSSRRQFLSRCAACAAYASLMPLGSLPAGALAPQELLPKSKARVRLVFSHLPKGQPTWPHAEFDYEARKRDLTAKLIQACPQVEFLPSTLHSAEDARKLLEQDTGIDGYLVYLLGIWTGVGKTIAAAGKPTLLVDDLYGGSGEFLKTFAESRRAGLRVAGVSSSDFKDVVQAIRYFETLRKLRDSLVLDITEKTTFWGDPAAIQQTLGPRIQKVSAAEVKAAYARTDRTDAAQWAKTWMHEARKVVEPSPEEIHKSGAMYLALRSLLEQHRAQALTIDCLSLYYSGQLTAYPCLGLFQLNNDGLVGACEGDLLSTITMLVMAYLVGRPGFISYPVIDTSKNQIIYTHCACASKMLGPGEPGYPYHIRTHSEDRKGASVRTLMPPGYTTTTCLFDCSRKEVVLHQAKTVGNIDEDKACRTKLAAEVKGDINKLLGEWDRYGWHRVTFFGDLKKQIVDIAALTGFKIVEEA